jgi:hypothetical protein
LTVQHRLAREVSVVPSERDKSKEQKAAESEVESFRKDLGPFVVAAETTRMVMVFTDAKESNHPLIFANDSFLQLAGYSPGRKCSARASISCSGAPPIAGQATRLARR